MWIFFGLQQYQERKNNTEMRQLQSPRKTLFLAVENGCVDVVRTG